MKNKLFLTLTMAVLLVSCNQKNKEAATDNTHMMDNDSTMMHNDTTMMNNNTKMMNENSAIYACPMHPEVQGKLNDKCRKCGMKLTVPVTETSEKKQ
ncbi:heavy metal-binding domain-containing protein [Flavobacterium sp. ZS1P70]|uniref:Heavy metal-binding domain-containing protein n=1 Tax=Flavobacterium zhoui TaxID=3230414 RepID=A0ABW6I119_9FLAO